MAHGDSSWAGRSGFRASLWRAADDSRALPASECDNTGSSCRSADASIAANSGQLFPEQLAYVFLILLRLLCGGYGRHLLLASRPFPAAQPAAGMSRAEGGGT